MKERWMYRIRLQFRKGTSTHTSVNKFFGENEREINWHVDVLISSWTNGGWIFTKREIVSKRQLL